jgi:GNAT superfamily N-acetyltransferase
MNSTGPQPADAIEIRPATGDDAAALAKLSNELGYPTTPVRASERLDALVGSADNAVFVACLPVGPVVGWIHVFVALRVESDRFAELGGFVVSGPYRRGGLGRQLLAAAEAWAVTRRVRMLRVRSRVQRSDAKRFYEGLGFAVAKQQNVLDKPLATDD